MKEIVAGFDDLSQGPTREIGSLNARGGMYYALLPVAQSLRTHDTSHAIILGHSDEGIVPSENLKSEVDSLGGEITLVRQSPKPPYAKRGEMTFPRL